VARLAYQEVKIVSGTSLSAEFDLRSHDLIGIDVPAGWDAAGITFTSCFVPDGVRLVPATEAFDKVVDDAGAEVTIAAVAASTYICFGTEMQAKLRALGRTKLRSGTSTTAVNQTADRLLTLILSPLDQ
jgi:hypothetical protein